MFVQTVLYGVTVYAFIDFRWTAAKFFWYFYMMFFTLLYTTYYGIMTVGLTPNASIASILSTGFIAIWMVFCGFLLPRPVSFSYQSLPNQLITLSSSCFFTSMVF